MKRSLLLGCGNSREKKIAVNGDTEWGELQTIDMNPNCGADLVMDLSILGRMGHPSEATTLRPLPFHDGTFDEIHAYDVLEHWGRQGDWQSWFCEAAEYRRLLKDGGLLCAIVPVGEDALADPGHCRFFQRNWFGFLNQKFYEENLAKGAQVTDYRWYWKLNFDIVHCEERSNHLAVVLRKA